MHEQDVKKNQKDVGLVLVAKDIIKELWRASVKSSLKFLQALLLIGKVELIVECLDAIVATMDNYVDETSFSSIISMIGCKHGWGILKSPLNGIFEKYMSNKVDNYCEFL